MKALVIDEPFNKTINLKRSNNYKCTGITFIYMVVNCD